MDRVNVLKFQTPNGLTKPHMQCWPRSDCSFRSSLIRVYIVCHSTQYFKKQLHKKLYLGQKVWNEVLEILGQLLYSVTPLIWSYKLFACSKTYFLVEWLKLLNNTSSNLRKCTFGQVHPANSLIRLIIQPCSLTCLGCPEEPLEPWLSIEHWLKTGQTAWISKPLWVCTENT